MTDPNEDVVKLMTSRILEAACEDGPIDGGVVVAALIIAAAIVQADSGLTSDEDMTTAANLLLVDTLAGLRSLEDVGGLGMN